MSAPHLQIVRPWQEAKATHLFPQGLVGESADFIYRAAPRPVVEIALVGALTLIGGIAGRTYNVSGGGLNQYILLIAGTGRGKEAASDGVDALIEPVAVSVPPIRDFVGPTEIMSSQGLLKWLGRQPCIFSIVGELGIKLKEMSTAKDGTTAYAIKRTLLILYGKSKKTSKQGAMAYSKREDNTAAVSRPSFTLMGETTGQTFYQNLNEDVVLDGLLRFLVFDYDGKRVPFNKGHGTVFPSPELVGKLAELTAHCLSLSSTNQVCDVIVNADAEKIFDDFNDFCDAQINNNAQGIVAHELFNRAHHKAMKLAALIAVGINYHTPKIDAETARWAVNTVHAQTAALVAKFTSGATGEVPTNEALRRTRMTKCVYNFAANPHDDKFTETREMRDTRIITQDRMQQQLYSTAPFRNAKIGPTQAFKNTLRDLLDGGILVEMSKSEMVKKYGKSCRAFAISNAEVIFEEGQSL